MRAAQPPEQIHSSDNIEAQAAEYLLRQRFWDWSDRDAAELECWLTSSVAHRVGYLRLQAGAARVERLAALRPPKLDQFSQTSGRANWRLGRQIGAIAASIGFVAILGLTAALYLFQTTLRTFATDVGGRALLKFADGTQMELNTDTAIRYSMTTAQRVVWLDRGEVYFTVSHDAAHPFTVVIGSHRITDLGTEFLVRTESNDVEVAVVKGRAQLEASDGPQPITTLLPGDDAVATATAFTVSKKSPQQLSDALAWQRGRLVFRNTALSEAVRQFNRYNLTKLLITDPAIARLKIGGEFQTVNVQDFLRLVHAVLKLHVERVGTDFAISGASRDATQAADHSSSE